MLHLLIIIFITTTTIIIIILTIITIIFKYAHRYMVVTSPPWAAALSSRWGLIPSEPSASAERGTGRLSAAQPGGLVFVDPGGRLRTIHQKGLHRPAVRHPIL